MMSLEKEIITKESSETTLNKFEIKIAKIINKLTKVALEDEFLTEDEKTLLDVITSDLQGYLIILNDYKDIYISEDDQKNKKENLANYKDKIWQNAYNYSMKEDGISEDLINILFELNSILKSDILD